MVGRIVSRARQVRLEHQAKLGRLVTIQEVADATGLDRKAIARLEENKTERYDGAILARLCAFYGVDVNELISYVPNQMDGVHPPPTATRLVAVGI